MGAAVICTLQISIYRTLNRYRAGLGKSDNLPMFVRIVCGHWPPNFNLSGGYSMNQKGSSKNIRMTPNKAYSTESATMALPPIIAFPIF